MELFGQTLTAGSGVFLLLALGLALSFEFVNGFHDTANAVATVIYTHSLKPWIAVVWSGCWNLVGVLMSTGAVAFSVVALLPVELVLNVGSGRLCHGLCPLDFRDFVESGHVVFGIARFELAYADWCHYGRRLGEFLAFPCSGVRGRY